MSHLDKAHSAWGDALPEWVRALAERADETSQNLVAREVGYSPSAISNIIGRTYAARDTTALEEAVRATVMAAQIDCPELGTTSLQQCLDWRARAAQPFAPLGSLHRVMRGACLSCPHNNGGK